MSDELKPCPWCKGKPETQRTVYRLHDGLTLEYWWVQCDNAKCPVMPESSSYDTEAEAIEAWNTRADDAPETTVDNAQADTREKLEADVGNAVCGIYYEGYNDGAVENPNGKRESIDNGTSLMLKLLDRQAVITHEMDNVWAKAQQTKIAELKAERDDLRNVVKQQAENFKKLEIELSQETHKAEDLRTAAYECEQLRKKLDKIKEIVDAI